MRIMQFNPNYIIFVVIAVGLSIMTLMFSRSINKSKVIEWLGINSLTLMLIHDPIKRLLIYVYAHMLGVGTDVVRESVIHVFVLTALLIMICIPIVMLINRYGYYLIGKASKER